MNQKPKSNKKKFSLTDIILILLGLFVLIRTPWANMNSFHYLLFFLYIFCIMMRITNMRKKNARKEKSQQQEDASTSTAEEKSAAPTADSTEEANETMDSEKEPPSEG